MGNGIILRVLEGTVLSPELTQTLGKILPDYKLEIYQQAPNYKRSITRRIDSLHAAFLFVLDAYPLDPKFSPITAATLKAFAAECRSACNLTKDSLEDLHKELEIFTARMVEMLAVCWPWPGGKPVKEATACLNEAECYRMMMGQGRPDIATLTTIERRGAKEYVLQYDESLPPHYDQLLAEIEIIKKSKYPKTPSWFRKLDEFEQAYFCNLDLKTIGPAEVVDDLNKFIVAWDDIRTKQLNITNDLIKIQTNSTPLPVWYNKLSVHLKGMVKVLAADPPNINENLKQFKLKIAGYATKLEFKNTLGLVATNPQWYWVIPDRQKSFLEHVLKNVKKSEDALAFISSRLRTLPLPSNYAEHSLLTLNAKGELINHFGKRGRSSHVVPRDCLHFPAAVQVRHVDSNFAKVMEKAKPDMPCLMQTLISPIHAVEHMKHYVPGIVAGLLPELPPDLELFKLARSAVARSERAKGTLQTNHPYNIAKRVYYTGSEDPDSLALLENAKKYVTKIEGLQELLDNYKNALESPLGSATFWDYDGRELFLSSLEQLITLTIGWYSYGSCVSGKDRKALELLHTDSMIIHKFLYGRWPKFGDPKDKEDRVRFVAIFVGLYVSRHQHEHAGQNAPGSEGIKTPGWYLPEDIVVAINKYLGIEKALDNDDRLATANEVKNIKGFKKYFFLADQLLCRLMAKQLGEANCTKLYDALSVLLNETRRFHKSKDSTWSLTWHKKESSSTPTGIEEMRVLMRDEKAGKDNVRRIGALFYIVLKRPETDETRTDATKSVYGHMRNVVKPPKPGLTPQALADAAIMDWTKLFEDSKEENVSPSPIVG